MSSFFVLNFNTSTPLFLDKHKFIRINMEEQNLTLAQEQAIKEHAAKLKADKKLKKIFPIVVFGTVSDDEKELYTVYLTEPTYPQFSKFMAASKKDEVTAMKALAKECFVDGDKELVDNDSLFLFGLMPELGVIINTRKSVIVNL